MQLEEYLLSVSASYYEVLRAKKALDIAKANVESASSIMKCNTWESRKVSAILSVYGKTI